ncbi:MAG: DUF5652 family protein [Candidatus Nanoarchaeia archaeon]|nr:DUF5652 family protein [Candidatus Nanoarchaeia archaeon]
MAAEDLLTMNSFLQPVADTLGVSLEVAMVILTIISIWSLVWKGFGLWKASKKDHKIWFVLMLILNTVGILEILYIYIFSKMNFKKEKKQEKVEKKK